ncbi:Fe-S cluster assembly sulfur transfer protein SufU [Fusibacter sp. JL216-2]|uniref:Fe-S cluster assembly sulfur transfer protein SufU n=1 Tax=Fusibacter sp. JL216-2 TaxID=3071453 RepID=UPI003D3516EC
MLDQMYTEIILEHNRNSPHKGQLETVTHTERGHNPNCGDDLTLHLEVEEGLIKNAKFTGTGCAISQASMSIMIDLILGQDKETALTLTDLYSKMIKGHELSPEDKNQLQDAQIFETLSKMPARVKCGTLGWHCLRVALMENDAK